MSSTAETRSGTEALTRAATGGGVGPRRRVRVPLLAAGVGLVLLAALVVLWGWSRAADRTEVVMLVEPVAAGAPIPESALSSTLIGVDAGVGSFYPAGIDLSGVVAATDLAVGDVLTPSLVAAAPSLPGDWREVGAVVPAGWFPSTIQLGDELRAVPTDVDVEVHVVVVTASVGDDGSLAVVLAVPPGDAARVAQWSANRDLALVRLP